MSDFNPSHLTMSPSPPATFSTTNQSSMPMLYYGLAMIGAAAIALILYNLITIITKMCNRRHMQSSQDEVVDAGMEGSSIMSFDNSRGNLLSSFKYKKEGGGGGGGGDDYECSICLSDLEEGEEVKKLPRCKHSFHVQCIDMWLCSHLDCPVCRTPVGHSCHHFTPQNVTQVMLATGGILV